MTMLEIRNLSVVRGQGAVAHRVELGHLSLHAGEVVAMTGESGCGKSTMLECMGLLLAPQSLDAYTLGHERRDIKALIERGAEPELARVRAGSLGFVLQSGGLLPFLTVRDNIDLPRRLLGMHGAGKQAERAVQALDIGPLMGKLPQALSIGERQRVAFVRAISHEPALILADEPTAALDPIRAQALFQLFLDIVRESRTAAIIVSHDWGLLRRFGLPSLKAAVRPGHTMFMREA